MLLLTQSQSTTNDNSSPSPENSKSPSAPPPPSSDALLESSEGGGVLIVVEDPQQIPVVVLAFLTWFIAFLSNCATSAYNVTATLPTFNHHITLANITAVSASVVGSTLLFYLLRNPSSVPEAVDDFIAGCPALSVLASQLPPFRSFVIVVAHLVSKTRWVHQVWVTMRLVISSCLSFLDAATDIISIRVFYRRRQYKFAIGCSVMILVCLLMQCFLVFLQNRRNGTKKVMIEVGWVLSMLKPGVDAWRAIRGEQEDGTLFTPQTEFIIAKCIELFCESIPSAIMQFMAFLLSVLAGQTNHASLVSVFVSILTISFVSCLITFDMDVKLSNRRKSPFYGLFKEGSMNRFKGFTLMWLFSMCHVTSKTLACAILALHGRNLLPLYLLLEMTVYLVYKTLRGDFLVW